MLPKTKFSDSRASTMLSEITDYEETGGHSSSSQSGDSEVSSRERPAAGRTEEGFLPKC